MKNKWICCKQCITNREQPQCMQQKINKLVTYCSIRYFMHTCINKHNVWQCNVVYVSVQFNTFFRIMNLRILKKNDNEKHSIRKKPLKW